MQPVLANAMIGDHSVASGPPVIMTEGADPTQNVMNHALQFNDANPNAHAQFDPRINPNENLGFLRYDQNGNITGKFAMNLAVEFYEVSEMRFQHEGSGIGQDAGQQTPEGVAKRVMVRYRTRGQDDTEVVDWIRDHANRINEKLIASLGIQQAWADWVNGTNLRQEGVPLTEIPGITHDQLALLATMRVNTCDHLAVLSEASNAERILGNKWRLLKQKAQQLMQIKQEAVRDHDLREALNKMTARAEAAERREAQNAARLERLEKMMADKGPVDPTEPSSVRHTPDSPPDEGAPARRVTVERDAAGAALQTG